MRPYAWVICGGWGSYCPSYRVTSYWAQGGGKYKVGNQRLQYIEVFWFLCETFPSALLGQIWSDWQDQISTAENFTIFLDILSIYIRYRYGLKVRSHLLLKISKIVHILNLKYCERKVWRQSEEKKSTEDTSRSSPLASEDLCRLPSHHCWDEIRSQQATLPKNFLLLHIIVIIMIDILILFPPSKLETPPWPPRVLPRSNYWGRESRKVSLSNN